MIRFDSTIPKVYSFTNIQSLKDMKVRRNLWNKETKQIISYANINADDYCDSITSAKLCREANQELRNCIKENDDMFLYYGINERIRKTLFSFTLMKYS